MKKSNTHGKAILNEIAANKSEILEFQACALTMQTGSRAEAKKAFEKIYSRYRDWIKFKILNAISLDAETTEDLLQDVFTKVYTKIHTYSPKYAFSTWLHKIAINTVIDYKRSLNVEVFSIEALQTNYADSNDESVGESLFQIKDDNADIYNAVVKMERKELVHMALNTVISNDREKLVINMFFMQGLSQEEIHIETKIPINSIKTFIFRAKDKLRTFLVQKSPELLLMDRFYKRDLKTIN